MPKTSHFRTEPILPNETGPFDELFFSPGRRDDSLLPDALPEPLSDLRSDLSLDASALLF